MSYFEIDVWPCRYVRSLNEGSTPTISTAWTRVVEAQCEEAADKAVAQYEKEMAAGLAKCVKAASADYDVDTTPVEVHCDRGRGL